MAPKGKPPAAEKEKDAKDAKDAKGKEDKKNEPKMPIYKDPNARDKIVLAATIMVIVALLLFLLYRIQWKRTIQLICAVDGLRGILVYRNSSFDSMDNTQILTEMSEFAAYGKDIENKTVFAVNEVKRLLLDSGLFGFNQHLYVLNRVPVTFDAAVTNCKMNKSLLVYIETKEEELRLGKFAAAQKTEFWIGLRRKNNEWKWITGTTLRPEYSGWVAKQKGLQDCTVQTICATNFNHCWEQRDCNQNRFYVCKMPPIAMLMSKDDGLLF